MTERGGRPMGRVATNADTTPGRVHEWRSDSGDVWRSMWPGGPRPRSYAAGRLDLEVVAERLRVWAGGSDA